MQRYKEWSLRDFQSAIEQVKKEAFADYPKAIWVPYIRALNLAEESGELAREERLLEEGLRGDLGKAEDAVGDILMATLGYCIARRWDAQAILETVFEKLKERWESGQLAGILSDQAPERPYLKQAIDSSPKPPRLIRHD